MAGRVVHLELPAKEGDRARKFYTSLFGWKLKDAEQPGLDYFMTEGIEPVIAVFTDADKRGPVVYFDVDDIDKAIKKTRELGGKADEKLPVPGQGWFAGCVDTEGNPFSLWQPDPAAPVYEPDQSQATAGTRT